MITTIQNLLTIVGIPSALVAAVAAIRQLKDGNREKALETRQRQAAAAQVQLKELFSSHLARDAMKMMDWDLRNYSAGKTLYTISSTELSHALGTVDLEFSDKEQYIRDCFEDFFDKVQIMAHLVEIEYLNFGDLAVLLVYYAKKISENRTIYSAFLETYGYSLADKFLKATLDSN